jgi:hypothetical protein
LPWKLAARGVFESGSQLLRMADPARVDARQLDLLRRRCRGRRRHDRDAYDESTRPFENPLHSPTLHELTRRVGRNSAGRQRALERESASVPSTVASTTAGSRIAEIPGRRSYCCSATNASSRPNRLRTSLRISLRRRRREVVGLVLHGDPAIVAARAKTATRAATSCSWPRFCSVAASGPTDRLLLGKPTDRDLAATGRLFETRLALEFCDSGSSRHDLGQRFCRAPVPCEEMKWRRR